MARIYWNEESFGDSCPLNWGAIAEAVNDHLEDYRNINDCDDEELSSHSERLWEQFCEEDEICGVTAEW